MQIKLKSIAEYRKIFSVYANFEYDGELKFRRFADIVRNDYIEADIDAYLIMINPGSCHEKTKDNPVKGIDCYSRFEMIECVCDLAQKCVMALMEACKLNKIRILNLSDYVNGNLDEALKKKEYFINNIFSDDRYDELNKYMSNDAVCIAAWGTNSDLTEYKIKAIKRIGENRIIGYQEKKDKPNYSYRYIKPRGKSQQELVIGKIADSYNEYMKNGHQQKRQI